MGAILVVSKTPTSQLTEPMYANNFNPWSRLNQFVTSAGLEQQFLFAPLYGLGDRAAFYAYLEAFGATHRANLSVVCVSGTPDPVAELFPFLRSRMVVVPKDLLMGPLELTHWVYGSPKPTSGQLFFTWHWAAGDGSSAQYSEKNCAKNPALTHKTLIKEILGLSMDVRPSALRADLVSPSITVGRSKKIMLCPSSNTIAAPDTPWWIDLALRLQALSFEPVFNVSMAASAQTAQGRAVGAISYDAFPNFDGPISSFLKEVTGYRGVIAARSGMCELLALAASVPYAVVSKKPITEFWRLGEGFGAPPEATVHLEGNDPQVAAITIENISKRWLI